MVLKYGFLEMSSAIMLPLAYGLLLILVLASLLWTPIAWAALFFFVSLVVKHWTDGLRDADPLWFLRPVFRPIEAIAGLYGLMRGMTRYGVRRHSRA